MASVPSEFSVGGWNFGTHGTNFEDGRLGFGLADIREAIKAKASPFQIRQLYQRAKREANVEPGYRAHTIGTAGGTQDWDPEIAKVLKEGYGANVRLPEQSKIRGGGFDFGAHGQYGFGKEDLKHILGAGATPDMPNYYDKIDRVQGLRDWAVQNKIGVGHEIDSYLSREHAPIPEPDEPDDIINPQIDQLTAEIDELKASLDKPPEIKPKSRQHVGHFVPSTTRMAGYDAGTGKRRPQSFKRRFERKGKGFNTALMLGSASRSGTQSKVLNV